MLRNVLIPKEFTEKQLKQNATDGDWLDLYNAAMEYFKLYPTKTVFKTRFKQGGVKHRLSIGRMAINGVYRYTISSL